MMGRSVWPFYTCTTFPLIHLLWLTVILLITLLCITCNHKVPGPLIKHVRLHEMKSLFFATSPVPFFSTQRAMFNTLCISDVDQDHPLSINYVSDDHHLGRYGFHSRPQNSESFGFVISGFVPISGAVAAAITTLSYCHHHILLRATSHRAPRFQWHLDTKTEVLTWVTTCFWLSCPWKGRTGRDNIIYMLALFLAM